MKYYFRHLYATIESRLATKEIIVVTGMRRVGKTTILRQVFEKIKSANKIFLDLENPLEQKIFEEKDYNNIWANLEPYGIAKNRKAYIFLDEIQAMPEAIKAIKYLYDHYNVKFFLTGSSSFYLKNLFPESLAGRKMVFELYPLTFEEFLFFKEKPRDFFGSWKSKLKNKNAVRAERVAKLYKEYLTYGGFPQVALSATVIEKKMRLVDIFKSYFEKDVQQLAHFKDINAFRDLLLLLLERVGSKLDISKLASEIGISRETVYNYLYFLQATYFIALLTPYTKNVDREVSGSKKVYICDNGFLNEFSRVDSGAMLENAVFQNLRRCGKINYYQKRSGAEIDFVLPEKRVALEVKCRGVARDYTKLKIAAKRIGIHEYYVISQNFSSEHGIISASEV